MAIGVFGLQVAYRLKRLEMMSTDDTHGWFGGGSLPALSSTVDRIDFSNDTGTANIRSSLSAVRGYLAATGNSNYGWFGGGNATGPAIVATVDRIDFSNDSSTTSPRGSLSAARYRLAATGNSNYGWFGGGATPTIVSTVDRIDFSNDATKASPRGPLSSTRNNLAATGNSNYGWFGGGGFFPVYYSIINRIDFSNDSSTASVRGSLSAARAYLSATGNSNYGWFGGGSPSIVAIIDRIDFSNDSATASVRGSLSAARGGLTATSGQAKGPAIKLQKAGNYGWFGGGFAPSGVGGGSSRVNRIDFSNDTVAVRGTLNSPSTGKYNLAATGNSNYGWFGGGYTPTTPSAGNTRVSTVDRIDFSNDSPIASIRGPLTSIRQLLSATGNSNYGWFGGGEYSGVATVDRINFANDSVSASPRGPLTIARGFLAATGNSNYGWFGGGYIQPSVPVNYYSRVDRIDFSNDSSTASIRGPLIAVRKTHAATGNSNYGWFGGGVTTPGGPASFTSTVDRIDFSNDSVSAIARGSLSSARYGLAATGNSNYGWFGGGTTNVGPIIVSTVDRIDFSNDSATASIRSPLSDTKTQNLAATSNTHIG